MNMHSTHPINPWTLWWWQRCVSDSWITCCYVLLCRSRSSLKRQHHRRLPSPPPPRPLSQQVPQPRQPHRCPYQKCWRQLPHQARQPNSFRTSRWCVSRSWWRKRRRAILSGLQRQHRLVGTMIVVSVVSKEIRIFLFGTVKNSSHCIVASLFEYKMSELAVTVYHPTQSEIGWQTVPDLWSCGGKSPYLQNCCASNNECSSVRRTQLSDTGVGDEWTVVSQVTPGHVQGKPRKPSPLPLLGHIY